MLADLCIEQRFKLSAFDPAELSDYGAFERSDPVIKAADILQVLN